MRSVYEIALLGRPSQAQIDAVTAVIVRAVESFGMRVGDEVSLLVTPTTFAPDKRCAAAAVFFGSVTGSASTTHDASDALHPLLRRGVPIVSVVSDLRRTRQELPTVLHPLNAIAYDEAAPERVATALLECVGLLPRQRRVFLSYRRTEAREAALQLFNALSERGFDVFLDTHGVAPGADFQAVLWHRLCESDALVMLDTPTYFDSRWTAAEFGRALAKGIAVLRVGWPDCTPSERTATASRAELLPVELDDATGRLAEAAVRRICLQLEEVRSLSHAVRHLNLASRVRIELERIGGRVFGTGAKGIIAAELPDRRVVAIHPTVGIPTSSTLHEATTTSPVGGMPAAVVYDHVGIHPEWMAHLAWLGEKVRSARLVKASEVGWALADWEAA